ncbi:hypothetical protein AAG747_10590 [Rapidithrix thailandica]|uniref:Beta-lactamase-inhibitor-like PepSY-like domain-containing protein n=1 Tax=Rapidithrix thailandica TaxID=413964 RepID=A0AAW9RX97_9BACT
MKHVISVALLMLFAGIANAQDPPQAVQKAVKALFGNAEVLQWEHNPKAYVAFLENGEEYHYCRVESNGVWTDKGVYAFLEDLPEAVQNSIENLSGIAAETGEFYTASLKNGDTAYMVFVDDGLAKSSFLVNAEGKVLRKESFPMQMEADEDYE